MRILGIDYGDARTGIAITDALKITAQGLETIYTNAAGEVADTVTKFEIAKDLLGYIYLILCGIQARLKRY